MRIRSAAGQPPLPPSIRPPDPFRASGLLVGIATLTVSMSGCREPSSPAEATEKRSPDLKPFIESYFDTWSKGQMDGYRDHFHPRAVVTFVSDGRVDSSLRAT